MRIGKVRKLSDVHNVADFRALAKRRLPFPVFHYIDGGGDDDADMYLVVTYANMAMLDGLRGKVDPIMTQVSGQSVSQSNAAYAARGKMRHIRGTELLRELKLK